MKTIACFGDSLIEGFPFSPENSWIAQVKKNTGIRMLNHGICGECCDDIKDRLIWRPLPKEVTHVLFEGGMNDIIQGCPLTFSIEQIKLAKQFCDEQNAAKKEFENKCCLLDFEPMFLTKKHRMEWFIWDGVHPKAETYEALGNFASPFLETWIKEK